MNIQYFIYIEIVLVQYILFDLCVFTGPGEALRQLVLLGSEEVEGACHEAMAAAEKVCKTKMNFYDLLWIWTPRCCKHCRVRLRSLQQWRIWTKKLRVPWASQRLLRVFLTSKEMEAKRSKGQQETGERWVLLAAKRGADGDGPNPKRQEWLWAAVAYLLGIVKDPEFFPRAFARPETLSSCAVAELKFHVLLRAI